MIRRLAAATSQRALTEALLLAAALILFICGTVLLNEGLTYRIVSQGLLLTSGLTALLAALRRRVWDGVWWRKALSELGFGALLLAGFAILVYGLLTLLSQAPLETSSSLDAVLTDIVALTAVFASGPLYVGFRVAVRLLLWWDGLRRRQLTWSLTHALLVVATAAALVVIAGFTALIYLSSPDAMAVPETGLLGQVLDLVIFSLFPAVSILGLLAIGGLLFVIPPSALFSYVVARRTTTRLRALAEAAARFRAGDYAARSPVEGEDEVAQLQADFNAMAADLEKSIAALETERDTVAGLLDARRQLIASVSHDLRTPAATLRSTLESALDRWDEDGPPPELEGDMTVMLGEVERLQKLIDDLFLLSRAEVGQLTLRLEPVDAGQVARQVVSAAAPLAWGSGRVEVAADLPPDLPAVRADADRLAQALHNLVHNAVRHTPPGGIVVVGARVEPHTLSLTVRDTGEGIAPDDLPRIWERFYKVEHHSAGAGLGLSIVKELVELMGGEVAVESTPGAGSCFALRLPRA